MFQLRRRRGEDKLSGGETTERGLLEAHWHHICFKFFNVLPCLSVRRNLKQVKFFFLNTSNKFIWINFALFMH